jgi:hypothetical protein
MREMSLLQKVDAVAQRKEEIGLAARVCVCDRRTQLMATFFSHINHG